MPVPSILKQTATPGTVGFGIVCAAVWLILLWAPRVHRKVAWLWLVSILAMYLTLSTPSVASVLVGRLPPIPVPILTSEPVGVLVVFDGDNRGGRSMASLNAYATLHPHAVIVLGAPLVV